MRGILAEPGGARGLFAGYGAFMLRDLPYDVLKFVAYEQLKAAYRKARTRGVGLGHFKNTNGGCPRSTKTSPDQRHSLFLRRPIQPLFSPPPLPLIPPPPQFRGGRELDGFETAALGGVTGALTGALTTPLDVIKVGA